MRTSRQLPRALGGQILHCEVFVRAGGRRNREVLQHARRKLAGDERNTCRQPFGQAQALLAARMQQTAHNSHFGHGNEHRHGLEVRERQLLVAQAVLLHFGPGIWASHWLHGLEPVSPPGRPMFVVFSRFGAFAVPCTVKQTASGLLFSSTAVRGFSVAVGPKTVRIAACRHSVVRFHGVSAAFPLQKKRNRPEFDVDEAMALVRKSAKAKFNEVRVLACCDARSRLLTACTGSLTWLVPCSPSTLQCSWA